jgi:hypothetical protein
VESESYEEGSRTARAGLFIISCPASAREELFLAVSDSCEDLEVVRGGDAFSFVGRGDDADRRVVGESAFAVKVEK